MPENIIKYRLLRHVLVDIGHADAHQNMAKVRHVARTSSEGYEIVKAEFDISEPRTLKLPDDLVYVPPVRLPEMSERYWERLVDESLDVAIKARTAHSGLRKKIQRNIENGTIDVIADPTGFLNGVPFDNSEEAEAEEAARAAAQAEEAAPVLEAPDVLNAAGTNRRPKARQ